MKFLDYLDFRNLFSDNDSKFELKTALIITVIPMITTGFAAFIIWVSTEMTYSFFTSLGFESGDTFKEAFYDKIFGEVSVYLSYSILYFSALFFIGSYLSKLLLRPFNKFKKVCENPFQNFSKLQLSMIEKEKLMMKFGNIFFQHVTQTHKKKIFKDVHISESYQEINHPPFDKVFFFQYFCFLTIIALASSIGLYLFSSEMFEATTTLAQQTLNVGGTNISGFFQTQKEILNLTTIASSVLMLVIYVGVSRNIVDKVNGVSYAFFRTMRSIINGEVNQRIWLRNSDPAHQVADEFNNFMDKLVAKYELKPSESTSQKPVLVSKEEIEDEYEEEYEDDFEEGYEEDFEEDSSPGPSKEESVASLPEDVPDLPPDVIPMEKAGVEIVTPDGYVIKGVDKEEVEALMIKLRAS